MADRVNSDHVVVCRQNIVNAKCDLSSYRLTFGETLRAPDASQLSIFNRVFTKELASEVCSGLPTFIQFKERDLGQALPKSFIGKKLVVEVLPPVGDIRQLEVNLGAMKDAGFDIALHGETALNGTKGLLLCTDYVFIDCKLESAHLERFFPLRDIYDCSLVGHRVADHRVFDSLKGHDFAYFTDEFVMQPDLRNRGTDAESASSRHVVVQLVTKLHSPDVKVSDLRDLLSQDARMTYRLFKLINSAAFRRVRKIESVQDAIVTLGLDRLKEWVSLIAMTGVHGKPPVLMMTGMVRAKMCELLAKEMNVSNPESYFMTGLFSILSAVLDMPQRTLLDEIKLAKEVRDALNRYVGPMGEVLKSVVAYEQRQWAHLCCKGVTAEQYRTAYMSALAWSGNAILALQ